MRGSPVYSLPCKGSFAEKQHLVKIGTVRPPYTPLKLHRPTPQLLLFQSMWSGRSRAVSTPPICPSDSSTRRFMFHYSKCGHSGPTKPAPVRSGGPFFHRHRCSCSSGQRHALHVFLQTSVLPRGRDLPAAARLPDTVQVTGGTARISEYLLLQSAQEHN